MPYIPYYASIYSYCTHTILLLYIDILYTYYTHIIHLNIYRNSGYTTNNESTADILTSWIDQLLIPEKEFKAPLYDYTNILNIRHKYPIPNTIKWIFCQQEACVIKKADV